MKMKFNYKHKTTGETQAKLFTLEEVESGQSRMFTEEMEGKGYNLERVLLDEQEKGRENG